MPDFLSRVFRLVHHLRAVPWDESHVFLVGEDRQFLLTGQLYGGLVPEIDGHRSVGDLVSAMADRFPASEVMYGLRTLEEHNHVVPAAVNIDDRVAAFWSSLDLNAALARERFDSTPIAVEGGSRDDARRLKAALQGAGIRVDDRATFRVLVVDDYLSLDAERMHRRTQGGPHPWMPVKPSGACAWVGPVFSARKGPCWECLASRLRLNRPVSEYVRSATGQPPIVPAARIDASVDAALHWCSLTLAKWIAEGRTGMLDSSLLALDASVLRADWHRVVRRPQCADCGDADWYSRRAEEPVRLTSVPRPVADDGGFRTQSPEETFDRLSHHVSPITGLLASIEPLHERNAPLRPVFVTTFRTPSRKVPPRAEDFHRHSAGKGRTVAQSRASAICEALERQCAVFQGDEPLRKARLLDLGDDGIHPNALQNFSSSQRAAVNLSSDDSRLAVPPAFDERAPIEWTPAWSLTRERRRWLPASYCYSQMPPLPERRCCVFNPNGHAAGNCVEEAILQAFLELAERDAVGVWWYNRLSRPAVNLESFEAPYFLALRQQYRSLGWSLWVLDVTNDLKIPCFVALARCEADGRFSIGFGCHLDARLGVQRALTELNQLFDPQNGKTPWGPGVKDATYLLPSAAPPTPRSAYTTPPARDLRADVLACVGVAAEAGLETLVIDQSRPDVELSVAKVVVPGLRHIWPRLGPGRLYDVPVRCGWLPKARTETELNPVPLLL